MLEIMSALFIWAYSLQPRGDRGKAYILLQVVGQPFWGWAWLWQVLVGVSGIFLKALGSQILYFFDLYIFHVFIDDGASVWGTRHEPPPPPPIGPPQSSYFKTFGLPETYISELCWNNYMEPLRNDWSPLGPHISIYIEPLELVFQPYWSPWTQRLSVLSPWK